MQSINSSKKTVKDISLYYSKVDDKLFKDFAFIDLMNQIIKDDCEFNYHFAIYTDISVIPVNILIPIFHTMYLGSAQHNVVINRSEDLWVLNTFTNNKYYVMRKPDDDFDYSPYNITVIDRITDIK